MRQISVKKILNGLTAAVLLLMSAACKAVPSYPIGTYLNTLAMETGIGDKETIDENFDSLLKWGIVKQEDAHKLEKDLDYAYLSETICALLEERREPLSLMKEKGFIGKNAKEKGRVSQKEAEEAIHLALRQINHRTFDARYQESLKKIIKKTGEDLFPGDLTVRDGQCYILREDQDELRYEKASYEEVYEELSLQATSLIDFTEAEIYPYGEEEADNSYINEWYTLLSSDNKHVFHRDGFNISYTVQRSGVDFHISRNEKGMNIYLDLGIRDMKTDLKWMDRENDLKNCFFALSFNTSEKFGVSNGNYKNYRWKFKDLDASSFMSLLNTMFVPLKNDEEVSLPLCQIRIPIKELPGIMLNLDLKIKLHASGKAELFLNNSHQLGFETKNGQLRLIHENTHNLNSILQSSAKALLGINAGVNTLGITLCDMELECGVKGSVASTLHFYDEEGNKESRDYDLAYSGLSELCNGNADVLVCGDVSLNWLMDLHFNTAATQMHKLGFSRSFSILDEENQIFGNLHHIENGQFVEKCTRGQRKQNPQMEEVKSDRIVLDSYAEVLKMNESYQILIKALPSGYRESDLVFQSDDSSIASCTNGLIKAEKPGSVHIRVSTTDGKYEALVNILVSTG